jgi:ATP-dependent DNA ligase
VMAKVKHVRTADCVVAGYRVHKSGPDAVGSLLLGLHDDGHAGVAQWADMFGGLMSVGVVGAFPAARRRELFAELQPLVCALEEHPWGGLAEIAEARRPTGSRWNPDKSLSFVPLRPERVLEVRYDHMEGARFRHPPQFVRWRPDRTPDSCGYAQLERPVRFDLGRILEEGADR